MTEFDDDTALTRRGDRWHGEMTDRWHIGRGPNGGYIAAFLTRALMNEAPVPDPLTMTTHYLERPAYAPIEVTVERLREGRSHATLTARLLQGDRPMAAAIATFGRLGDSAEESVQAEMPEFPGPDDCVARRLPAPPMPGMTFRDRFDQRMPADLTAGPARIGGWTRLVDRDLDALAIPLFMDSWPPAMFATYMGGYAPTLELTVHWRSRPRTFWHLGLFTSRFFMGGYVEEDGELWGEDGRLVAQSRQLARFIPPPAP
jgi:acyl-CoA thioesterase